MIITAQTQLQADTLYQGYASLSPYEQCVLKVLAVVYRPIGMSKFNKLLTQIKREEIFPEQACLKALSAEQREQLVKKGYILYDKSGLCLNRLLCNRLTWDCVNAQTYLPLAKSAESVLYTRTNYEWQPQPADLQVIIRDAHFLHGGKGLEALLTFNKNPQVLDLTTTRILSELYFLPFDLTQFLTLSNQLQYQSFAACFTLNNQNGNSNEFLLAQLETVWAKNPSNSLLAHLCAEIYLYALRFDRCVQLIPADDTSCYGLQINAAVKMLRGEFNEALPLFKQAIAAKNKYARRKRQYLAGTFGLLYKLCLLVLAGKNAALYEVVFEQITAECADKNTGIHVHQILNVLSDLTKCLSSGTQYTTAFHSLELIYKDAPYFHHLHVLIEFLGSVWCGQARTQIDIPKMQRKITAASVFFRDSDMCIFAALGEQLLLAAKQQPVKDNNTANGAMIHFPSLVHRKEEWDLALEKLIALNPVNNNEEPKTNKKPEKPVRLIWEMHPPLSNPEFKAREQKQSAKGWSKGRPVSLKRLYKEQASFAYLTDADKKMCDAIAIYQSWDYYHSTEYRLEGIAALLAAKEVEYLFLDGDLQHPIDLLQKEPELLISQQGDQLLMSIANLPSFLDEEGLSFSLIESSEYAYTFTLFNQSHTKVADIVGEGGLMIPVAAKARVLESISAIAPLLNIQSDIPELETGLETVECDPHLVVNIQPLGAGLEFTCMVMPFGDEGPAFKPMIGNVKLTTELGNKRIATQRDLLREQVLLDALDEHCPSFLAMPDNVLAIDDPQLALETLEQLEAVTHNKQQALLLRLRWPKGKKVRLSKPLQSQHLQLSVGKQSEWFDLTGELTIDEGQVVEIQKLLDLVSCASSRFVSLDNGQIMALSQDLKERLDLLNQVTDEGKFHPLASLHVGEATTGMRMKTIHAWQAQATKMHEANDIKPALPTTLQAQLRDYQLEGFDWMSRLAHWKAGACLADDMGLGKTLQALAVLLSRAAGGPSLVIAPTSVCFNWQLEALKFAPTLNNRFFSDYTNGEQREQLLKEVTSFDVVIISYGLLQRESELLTQVHWHTIVADEAQALKNPTTKRTQAAYALKGDFKIITTGTPIENNLTELWSLFRFITPGLLGNLKAFGKRYAFPIENVKEDKLAARKASLGLKTLIQPFILRRMKNQVLTELPSRTEINTLVELSPKEQDFYEALRRNAVDNIANANATSNEGEQRIRMLAELVKLRQACCNPKLVVPETDLSSAKLAALDALLDELQLNNHKALIFSQFVGHLQLIKKHLEGRGISYQYLDGSTPQKLRQTRVNSFQNGESDVFLISLKAGGSGLNLTAADYVIHMDPWWNPAVEDQASDRAHRMGQKRPVTIYRLIAKNTIEERIVALHQHKRDLADKLLAGNEQATKLSVDDVLNMLKEDF